MKSSIKLSAVIITYNEEDNIGRCLDSVKETADEIVVVDSFSSDATADICKSRGVEFIQHPFEGHIEQKNYALSCAGYDYVLSLDADEVLSDTLVASIQATKQRWSADGYSMNRRTRYCGRWIRSIQEY